MKNKKIAKFTAFLTSLQRNMERERETETERDTDRLGTNQIHLAYSIETQALNPHSQINE